MAAANGGSRFNTALRGQIDSLLGGLSDATGIETAIGLVGPSAAPSGPTGPTPNVDLDGDGVNDFYVEPLTERGTATALHGLNVRDRPDLTATIVGGAQEGQQLNLIGKSGEWYAIELAGKTRFVHSSFVRIRATP